MKNPLKMELILWGCLLVIGILYFLMKDRIEDAVPFWRFYELGTVAIWASVYFGVVSTQLRRKEREEQERQRRQAKNKGWLFRLFGIRKQHSKQTQIDDEPPTKSQGEQSLGFQSRRN